MKLPYAWVRAHGILAVPAALDSEPDSLWLSPSADLQALALAQANWPHARLLAVDSDRFSRRVAELYSQPDDAAAVLDAATAELDLERLVEQMPGVEDLLDTQDDAPVIRMINALLGQAVRDRASDIHIEPFESNSVVRFRVDGTLRDIVRPPRGLHAALVSRLKILASLDIAEKRLPQDGRISLRIAGRSIDLRLSTLPTAHGERAVLRLLEKDQGRLDLAALGLDPQLLAQLDRLIRQPHGIVLVTGPTGSGKTTTLYAAISRLDASTTNILTVEDPVEYDLPGIGQTPVNPRIDMSFAAALRAILRQDPDVIMIGEIRDLETAQIAVQASLTGHLVLATLHTNDACSAVTRLTDMGIEPFLLSSSLLGVMAQRLVRTLCPDCRVQVPGATPARWRAVGCARCGHTGYFGRTGIHELLEVDPTVADLIHRGATEAQLRDHARGRGMRSLREDAERWIANGTSSLEEVLRVTRNDLEGSG